MAVCSLGCGRTCPKHSSWDICAVCRANIAGWSLRHTSEVKEYQEALEVRSKRLAEVRNRASDSYLHQLQAKRRKRRTTTNEGAST